MPNAAWHELGYLAAEVRQDQCIRCGLTNSRRAGYLFRYASPAGTGIGSVLKGKKVGAEDVDTK